MNLSLEMLRQSLPDGGLFGGGGWRWSPEPLRLNRAEVRRLRGLGHPLAKFQQACDALYRRSADGKIPGWLAGLLDAGKPDWLVAYQRESGQAHRFPGVIRPDLILTPGGFAMSELDSVPGGIGVTAWLSRTYAEAGWEVLGGADGMVEGFRKLLPAGGVVLVSAESADYRPEMEWLVGRLGSAWEVATAETYQPDGRAVYRFFELFDWQSVSAARELAKAAADGGQQVTPPFISHLEDKLWLALLWTPALRPLWEQTLRGAHLQRLREIVPFGWVLDPAPLPPHASLPRLEAHSWEEVAGFSQKDRRLVLKISGFHETAWGSRGVFMGHDLSAAEWRERLLHAVDENHRQPWLLQEFHEGRIIEHPVYREDGSIETLRGRARLCPYYFTDPSTGETTLGGCLATLVPADKKKIHGMRDGVLLPCIEET